MTILGQHRVHFDKLEEDEKEISYFLDFAKQNLRSNPEEMKKVLDEVIKICKRKNYKSAYADAMLNIGWYHSDRGNYEEAIKIYIEVENIYIETNDEEGICYVCSALLASYIEVGMMELAVEVGLRGVQLAEKTKNENARVSTILNLCMAYMELEDYEEVQHYVGVLDAIQSTLDTNRQYILISIKGELYYQLNQLDLAYKYYIKAREFIERYEYEFYLPGLLCLGGKINYQRKDYISCEKDFDEALFYAEKFQQPMMKIEALLQRIYYLEYIQQYDRAKQDTLQAIEIANTLKSYLSLKQLYAILSRIYKKIGNYEKALQALEIYCEYEAQTNNITSNISLVKLKNQALKEKVATYQALYKKMERLSNTGKELTSHLDINNIFEIIYKQIKEILDVNVFGIALYQQEQQVLDCRIFIKDGIEQNLGRISLEDENSLGVRCLKEKKEIFTNNLKSDESNIGSLIYTPLLIEDKAIGVLTIQSYKQGAYDTNDLKTLEILSSYVSIALWNSMLFEQVNYLASYDELTHILSRREIINKGKYLLKNTKQTGKPLSVMMIDIDYFKKINDAYGHPVGDKVLQITAKVIKESTRDQDFVGRYGGEEFIIVLSGIGKEKAAHIAERIRESIMKVDYKTYVEVSINVTISIGVYSYEGIEDFYEGVKYADQALYRAKEAGRNRVDVY